MLVGTQLCGDSGLHGFQDVAEVVPVMLWGDVDVKTWCSMIVPWISLHRSFMDYNFASPGDQRSGILIKYSFYLVVCRYPWVDPGAS